VSLSSQDYGTAAEHERLARGERQYWIVSEAELEGERIRATLAAPGSDWMWVSDDGFWRPDVRAPFKTHDGATVLMHYTGLVEQTPVFKAAAEADRPTSWDDQYMRLMIRFDTGASAYRWLNTSSSREGAFSVVVASNMRCFECHRRRQQGQKRREP
jgi:Protein of unknown function (DUF3237)